MKYRFAEMIWYEIKEAAEQGRVAVLPVATYEDHGPHLPVDVDVLLTNEICERAVARIPSEAILIPPVNHGYSPHYKGFHGTIITWGTFGIAQGARERRTFPGRGHRRADRVDRQDEGDADSAAARSA